MTPFCDERTKATPVKTAGTSTKGAVTGNGSSNGRKTPFLFLEDLADNRLAGTTEDAPSETTTVVGDVVDNASNTTSIDGVVARATDETGPGAAWVWTSVM